MPTYKLHIESGPDIGRQFEIKPEGASIGRSNQNDIAIADAQLSRHHCKVYFLGDELWVSDLATLNGTVHNGVVIREDVKLAVGDTITIGDSVLRLLNASPQPQTAPVPAPAPTPEPAPAIANPSGAPIDLGFNGDQPPPSQTPPDVRKTLLRALAAFVALCAIAIAVKLALGDGEDEPEAMTPVAVRVEDDVRIHYVKLEGSAENVFRYELALAPDGALSVSIDDLGQGRQVRKATETPVAPELRADLARKFANAGFFEMDARYEGVPLKNTWTAYTLTGIVNGRAATVAVRNRLEPEAFKTLREAIETFARNELGLWAVEFPREKLLELATENIILARKLYDERAIRLDNLYNATRTYKSAIAYLDTIEPKPSFFNEAVTELGVAETELETLHRDKNWQAEHAVNTRNWELAASTLRELMDIVPDRADPRHKDVERRLLDVESRIRKQRK